MIKIKVTNPVTNTEFVREFQDEASAELWISQQEKIGAFGKQERWIHEDDLAFKNEDRSKASSAELVGGPDEEKKRFFFPAQYTISVSEIESTDKFSMTESALHYLNKTDWYIVRKMETGIEVPKEVQIARHAARQMIER